MTLRNKIPKLANALVGIIAMDEMKMESLFLESPHRVIRSGLLHIVQCTRQAVNLVNARPSNPKSVLNFKKMQSEVL